MYQFGLAYTFSAEPREEGRPFANRYRYEIVVNEGRGFLASFEPLNEAKYHGVSTSGALKPGTNLPGDDDNKLHVARLILDEVKKQGGGD